MTASSTAWNDSSAEAQRLWRRAAVLGSLWASFEIVVGSFLHSLRLPFTGMILSAVGVVILVAGERMWSDPRLLWRAALICALMKSISPNAIIFGPMIAIYMEGLLLYLAVRLLGANWFGYATGGALAVSWSLVQKIVSLLLIYGTNLRALYVATYGFAAKVLAIRKVGAYDLLLVLCAVQCLVGIIAASLAMRMSRQAPDALPVRISAPRRAALEADPARRYSALLLCATLALLVAGIWIANAAHMGIAAAFTAAFVAFEAFAYPRGLGRLRRPRLWLELAAIMLLSGIVLGGLQRNAWLAGLAIGARMGLRATLVIVGFSTIAAELRNPRIVAWLAGNRLSSLSSALHSAFEFLPSFTAALSEQKRAWKHPMRAMAELVAMAEALEASTTAPLKPVTVLITGEKGEGKTSFAESVVNELRARGYEVAGILALGHWAADGERSGFDIVDLATGRTTALARLGKASSVTFGRFGFEPEGLCFGREALAPEKLQRADVIVVDEVGRWELEGGGWAACLDALMSARKAKLIVTREQFAEEVSRRWAAGEAVKAPVSSATTGDVLRLLGAQETKAGAP